MCVCVCDCACVQFCMVCSTGYHVFRCHSAEANLQWLALDMTGISVGILGCYLPAIHYGFYCLSVSYHALLYCLYFVLLGHYVFRAITYKWLQISIYPNFYFQISGILHVSSRYPLVICDAKICTKSSFRVTQYSVSELQYWPFSKCTSS